MITKSPSTGTDPWFWSTVTAEFLYRCCGAATRFAFPTGGSRHYNRKLKRRYENLFCGYENAEGRDVPGQAVQLHGGKVTYQDGKTESLPWSTWWKHL